MRIRLVTLAAVGLAVAAHAGTLKCPPDSVKVGNVCVDIYEASVWHIDPVANKALVQKIQQGKATLDDLTAGGATELGASPGCSGSTDYGVGYPADGNWVRVPFSVPPSPGVYAISVAGVPPSACITWFQAEQACRLSGKRLLTNQEWQAAAQGTVDPGENDGLANTKCNTLAAGPRSTGSAGSTPGAFDTCISNWGAQDMVGNVNEWVGDWADFNNTGCTDSTTAFGFTGTGDFVCFGGDGSRKVPGSLFRGGAWFGGMFSGVFAVSSGAPPFVVDTSIGFRCAR
jgi:hypothetical protein